MAILPDQDLGFNGASTTAITVSGTFPAGALILVEVEFGTATAGQSISITSGNTFTNIVTRENSATNNLVYWHGYIINWAGGALSTTFTLSGTGKDAAARLLSFSGVKNVAPLLLTPKDAGGAPNSATFDSGAASGTVPGNSLIVGFFGYANSATRTFSAPTGSPKYGWTLTATSNGSSGNTPHGHAVFTWVILNSGPLPQPQAIVTASGTASYSATVVAFQEDYNPYVDFAAPLLQVARVAPTPVTTSTRTVTPVSMPLIATNTRVVPASMPLIATNTRVVPESMPLIATLTRVVTPASMPLIATLTRVVPESMPLIGTQTRVVPESMPLIATLTRVVPEGMPLIATNTRVVPAQMPLSGGLARVVPASMPLIATNTRVVPESMPLVSTLTRTVSESMPLIWTPTRIVPASLPLVATLTRVVPAQMPVNIPLAGPLITPVGSIGAGTSPGGSIAASTVPSGSVQAGVSPGGIIQAGTTPGGTIAAGQEPGGTIVRN